MSGEEPLRELLRQAEAEATRLSSERARVAALLASAPRSRMRLAGLVASLALGGLGFAAPWLLETRSLARRERLEERRLAQAQAEEELRSAECQREAMEARVALNQCQAARPAWGRPEPSPSATPPAQRRPSCPCMPNDPLCSCQ